MREIEKPQLKTKPTTAEIEALKLLPVLHEGAENDGCHLDAETCKRLLFILRTSVSLEPLLDIMSAMIHRTTLAWTPEDFKQRKDETNDD